MINRVILIGNIGKDPEVRRLESGKVVASFSLATSESYQDKTSGEWQEQTEWHQITAWGKRAEQSEKYKKGMTLYVEGKIAYRKYTDKEGVERKSTEINVNYMRKIKDPGNSGNPYSGDPSNAGFPEPEKQASNNKDTPKDDMPF